MSTSDEQKEKTFDRAENMRRINAERLAKKGVEKLNLQIDADVVEWLVQHDKALEATPKNDLSSIKVQTNSLGVDVEALASKLSAKLVHNGDGHATFRKDGIDACVNTRQDEAMVIKQLAGMGIR